MNKYIFRNFLSFFALRTTFYPLILSNGIPVVLVSKGSLATQKVIEKMSDCPSHSLDKFSLGGRVVLLVGMEE